MKVSRLLDTAEYITIQMLNTNQFYYLRPVLAFQGYCHCHNSSPIQAGIAKFGPEVQNNMVKVPIVWGTHDVYNTRMADT